MDCGTLHDPLDNVELVKKIIKKQMSNYSNVQVITKKDFKLLKQYLIPEVYDINSGVSFGPLVEYGSEFIKVPHSYFNGDSDVPFNKVWGVIYILPRVSKKRLK